MNKINQLLTISALALSVVIPMSSFAQTAMDHSKMGMSHPAAMTDGEIKKLDVANGKITIKHGHMDLPGMTMVFTVKDKSLLSQVKPGDKVKFMVVNEGGKLVVTDIQPAQ
jgi:Cu(I)/Ag(I) efflux system periplasmic protein CusF